MATINVLDSVGATVAIEKPLAPGRVAAASSRPVVLSTEDFAAISTLATQATLAAQSAKLPAVLGPAAYSASMAVVAPRSATGTTSQVAGSASAVTILAPNAARLGGIIVNDSTAVLYLILSSTTPTSAIYSYKMQQQDTVEIPANYTGIIKGIWASAAGNAVVTELS